MTQQNNGPTYPGQGQSGQPNQNPGQNNNQNPNQNPYQQAYEAGYQQGFQNAQGAQQNAQNQQGGNPYAGPNMNNGNANNFAGETFGQPGPNFGPRPNTSQNAWERFSQREQFHWDLGSIAASALKATRSMFLWGGAIMLIVGLLVLCFPAVSINVMTIVLGILFAVFGIGRIVAAFTASGTPAGWRVLDGLAGILLVLSSVFILRHVYASTGILLTFISITLGISWIVEGFTTLIEGTGFMNTGWSIFSAIVSIIGGFVLLFWPMSSMQVLIIYLSIMLIIFGIIWIVRGLNMPKVK